MNTTVISVFILVGNLISIPAALYRLTVGELMGVSVYWWIGLLITNLLAVLYAIARLNLSAETPLSSSETLPHQHFE